MSEPASGAPEVGLTRRHMLESLVALALLALPGRSAFAANAAAPAASGTPLAPAATAAGGISAASLLNTAEKLDAAALLDDALAATYLDALSALVGEAPLARLAALVEATPPTGLDAAIRQQGLEPAAQAVVAAFYSGMVGTGARETLVTYLMALVWGATSFTKPPSLCGGVFGYWTDPPTGAPSQLVAAPSSAK